MEMFVTEQDNVSGKINPADLFYHLHFFISSQIPTSDFAFYN